MAKHDARLAKLAVKERRSRTVARLLSEGGSVHVKAADKMVVEAGVLNRSTEKRRAEHRGERPPPKIGFVNEYNRLLLELRRMPERARTVSDPAALIVEAERVVVRLMDLATILGIKKHERPSSDQWLDPIEVAVRIRTLNTPNLIKKRERTIANHQPMKAGRGCYCEICRYVRSGEMTMAGVFIEKRR